MAQEQRSEKRPATEYRAEFKPELARDDSLPISAKVGLCAPC